MKILMIGKYYYPFQGGIETVVKNLAEGLQENGHEVTVLCAAHGITGHEEGMNGVHVIRSPRFGSLFSQPLCPTLPLSILRMAKKFDLVHLHTPHPLCESTALALPSQIPLVVTYHSDVVRQRLLLPAYRILLHSLLKKVRAIAVPTEMHIENSSFLPLYRKKCQIIPFVINPEDFVSTEVIEKETKHLKEKYGKFILFVGRLIGYKGLHYLLEAMQDIPAKLLIVGTGPLKASLEKTAEVLGVSKKVHFLGLVSSTDSLIAHYYASEFLVLPSISKTEAFGMVLLEAMACKKAMITTRLPSGVQIVNEDGVTGFQVEPGNPSSISTAAQQLLADESLRLKMGEAAKLRFDTYFSRQAMVRGYESFYNEVMES